ncbi:MAG TPA: hypothetical protein VFS88_03050 [Micavibrio sp.]|nr:hypothetical protein [Micavibrio sp.]
MTSPKLNKSNGRKCDGENLRTAFVRAVDAATALTHDKKIRNMILFAGGELEKELPFANGTCQYQVKIPPGRYDALKEGWPLFEARLDKPYKGPSAFQRTSKPRPAVS